MTSPEWFGVRVDHVRTSRDPKDYTIGCGQTPDDHQAGEVFKSGRVCAGAGTVESCQLCPFSPTYWRST